MRILLTIHHELDADTGAAGATMQLAHALRGLGHDAEVYSWSDLPDRLGPREREASFPAWVLGRIRRAAREGVDVVDASTCDAWLWLVARQALGAGHRGPAVLTRTHGLEHSYRDARTAEATTTGESIGLPERVYHGFWRLRETEWTLRMSDAALFLNSADRDRALRELGVAPQRSRLVANGIPDLFAGRPAPAVAPAAPGLGLVQIGSWDPRKGIRQTVEAVGALMLRRPEVRLQILGSGEATDPGAIRDAFPQSVRDRVTVVPSFSRESLPELLANSHVLLQPSLVEGWGMALLEGMACGLAPVSSRVGVAQDAIVDGESGLLVATGDAGDLRAALERLDSDRGLLERLRTGAHLAAQRYPWSRVAAETAAVYADVAAARRLRRGR